MPFHFCPQCGKKLQPDFRFCPSCGEKLPSSEEDPDSVSLTPSLGLSPTKWTEAQTSVIKTSPASSTGCTPKDSQALVSCLTPSTTVTTRPALRKSRNSLRFDKEVSFSFQDATLSAMSSSKSVLSEDSGIGSLRTPTKSSSVTSKPSTATEPSLVLPSASVVTSPRSVRGKAKPSSPAVKQAEDKTGSKVEELAVDGSVGVISSPFSSPTSKSPSRGKSKAKRAKHALNEEPLQEGEEVTDTTGKKWRLGKVLTQSTTEITYEVFQTISRSNSKDSNHILKLGAKDGRIFNEQNFLQRAAKPPTVEKWIKFNKMDFLGIPSCVGFGPHADSYRFLIFPDMGQCLQSVMKEDKLLSEKTVLQLTCRILDVLQYIHSNEYVHADISAENIFIKPEPISQVYLVGYCHAFRYCPGGQHVEYREASRTPHEGTTEFISLDAHKGAAPSRRSDLQSLGYCMLRWHTGTLPWTELTNPEQVAAQKQRCMEDVPALLHQCFGRKRVSAAFQSFLAAVMALQYSEQPNYSALKVTLSDALVKLGGSLEQPISV